jgi:hypothetical protein
MVYMTIDRFDAIALAKANAEELERKNFLASSQCNQPVTAPVNWKYDDGKIGRSSEKPNSPIESSKDAGEYNPTSLGITKAGSKPDENTPPVPIRSNLLDPPKLSRIGIKSQSFTNTTQWKNSASSRHSSVDDVLTEVEIPPLKKPLDPIPSTQTDLESSIARIGNNLNGSKRSKDNLLIQLSEADSLNESIEDVGDLDDDSLSVHDITPIRTESLSIE